MGKLSARGGLRQDKQGRRKGENKQVILTGQERGTHTCRDLLHLNHSLGGGVEVFNSIM